MSGQVTTVPGCWARWRTFLQTHIRYEVITLLFLVMVINQADRATLSVASSPMSKTLHLGPVQIGWLFSSFAWAYMLCQIPGGWFIDRFGGKRTLATAIFLWSAFTGLVGFTGLLSTSVATIAIFILIFLVGMAAAPSFPSNSKIVAAWFPVSERGTASSIFNSSQYFATAVFTPLLAWIGSRWGWEAIFFFMGSIGILAGFLFARRVQPPERTARLTREERELLREGGALLQSVPSNKSSTGTTSVEKPAHGQWYYTRKLLGSRMMLGIYLGQYSISTLTFFFMTWFPMYLVQQRGAPLLEAGLLASIPAVCGFLGGISGGMLSDFLLRHGMPLSTARKAPLCLGMLLSALIIACNYANSDTWVVTLMALAFFGKGLGAMGWAIVSDVSPAGHAGLNASIFNTFGSAAGITTPIAIGYLVGHMHSFNGALIYVGVHALIAIAGFVIIAGPLKRMEPLK